MGDKLDTQKGEMLKPGSLLLMPPGHAHYVWTGNEETIFQLHSWADRDRLCQSGR
jgi:hypothetical protein